MLVAASALVLLGAGCFGGGGGTTTGKHGEPTSPGTLPSGGMSKTLHGTGVTLVAVVYGGSGDVSSNLFTTPPKAGNHFTAVKVGLKNMGPNVYRADLTQAMTILNDQGILFHGVAGKQGLAKVALKKDETVYGRVYFQLRNDTRVQSVRFRPFGAASAVSVYVIRGGAKSGKASKPLPTGGVSKVVRVPGHALKAVVYGGSSVDDKTLGMTPASGEHFVSVKVGFKNLSAKLYSVNLVPSLSVVNTEDKTFRAIDAGKHGMVRVVLAKGETVKGRVFSEITNGTRIRSVRFRPFGPKTKTYTFNIRGG